jgi:hypothetical protein
VPGQSGASVIWKLRNCVIHLQVIGSEPPRHHFSTTWRPSESSDEKMVSLTGIESVSVDYREARSVEEIRLAVCRSEIVPQIVP